MMSFYHECYDGVGALSGRFYVAGLADYDTTCNNSLGM